MIDALLKLLGITEDLPEEECVQERIKHATAVLLVEIARADHELQGKRDPGDAQSARGIIRLD